MKKIIHLILFVSALAGAHSLQAQTTCDNGRFNTRAHFSDASIRKDTIYFGSNTAVAGGNQDLYLNFYESTGDTLTQRPLILFTFGGSFVGGNREDVDDVCRELAKMGYAVAAVDYRVGQFLPDRRTTTLAVVRGMHDMKAAIRFFYKDAQQDNLFRVDTNRIMVGGISAGAITAIHAAYLDKESEIPGYLSGDTAAIGGIHGKSGNAGYSEHVIGVISMSGTIGDSAWIEAGDADIISFHDTGDQTVPYGTDTIIVFNVFNTGLEADGSGSIKIRVDNLGIRNELHTYPRAGHVAYLQNAVEYDSTMDQTMRFIAPLACRDISTIPAYQNSILPGDTVWINSVAHVVRISTPAHLNAGDTVVAGTSDNGMVTFVANGNGDIDAGDLISVSGTDVNSDAENIGTVQSVIEGIEETNAVSSLAVSPNPFHGVTAVQYTLTKGATVSLEVFDMVGKRQQVLVNNQTQAGGTFNYSLNVNQQAKGIYMVKLTVNGISNVQKIVLQ